MPTPIIVDYDIGFDWDDMVAHLFVTGSPELQVLLIITNDECGGRRARFARQLVRLADLNIPVVAGTDLGNEHFVVGDLLDEDDVDLNDDWCGAIRQCLQDYHEVTYIGLGAMTNIAKFITDYPVESRRLRLIQMGGGIGRVYRRGAPTPEYNIRLDPAAFVSVLRSNLPASFVMRHTTNRSEIEVNPDSPLVTRMRESSRPEMVLAADYFDLWVRARGHGSYLHDPLTCSSVINHDLVSFASGRFTIDSEGVLNITPESRENLRKRLISQLDERDELRTHLEGPSDQLTTTQAFDVRFSCKAAYDKFLELLTQRLFV